MLTEFFLFDILGAAAPILFVIYWAFSGRIVIDFEPHWAVRLFFFAGLLVYPLFTPAVIYALYYRQVSKKIRAPRHA
ncbi:MAG TPA: hypothetical protein VD996_00960 [Chitinophagaceae bacterium]|nr:hypothetical protein [Chitinophagaceae bacterium]